MDKKNIILIGIIAVLAAYILFFVQAPLKVDVKGYEVKIDSLQHTVDSIYVENGKLDDQIAGYESEILFQDDKIQSLKDKIVLIKQETHEKVKSVDSFTDDELERFFTERYQGLISDSTAKADSTSGN
jgi:peptidoglycan hydrolase CwlO-like protein